MKNEHLAEIEIQEYILSSSPTIGSAFEHLQVCPKCRSKAEIYRQLILGIQAQDSPAFDFDLSASVMSKITEKKTNTSYFPLIWIFVSIAIGAILASSYFFGQFFSVKLTDISSMLVVTTATILLLFQGLELIRNYKNQMKALDLN